MALAALSTGTSHTGNLNSAYGMSPLPWGAEATEPERDRVPARGGDAFPAAVQRALTDLRINPDTSARRSGVVTGYSATNVYPGMSADDPKEAGQDTYQLMHDLFMAIHQEQVALAHSTADRGSAVQRGYFPSLTAGLQSLVSKIEMEAAGTGTAQPSIATGAGTLLAKVRADYQRLLAGVQTHNGVVAGGQQSRALPDLQTFLHTLSLSLQDQSVSAGGIGGLISISA